MTVLANTYELGRELARGGMATVYLATELEGGRSVVVKRMHEHLSDEPELLALFEDEARLMPQLLHPNIVRVLAVLKKPGALALVLEHVRGGNLRTLSRTATARKRPPTPGLVAAIMARAARGLAAAHGATDRVTGQPLKVIHRDISPDNILLSIDGEVKLSDFGIARAEMRVSKTAPGTLRGKVRFMPPEQLLDQSLDQRADLWAMGVTFFEALTAEKCFDQENSGALLNAILHGPAPEVRDRRPDVPASMSDVIARCLVKEPAARIGTAQELAEALDECVLATGTKVTDRDIADWVRSIVPDNMLDFVQTPGDELVLDSDGRLLRKADGAVAESPRSRAPTVAEPLAAAHPTDELELARPVRPRTGSFIDGTPAHAGVAPGVSVGGAASAYQGPDDALPHQAPPSGLAQKLLLGLGVVALVGVVGLLVVTRMNTSAELDSKRAEAAAQLEAMKAAVDRAMPTPPAAPAARPGAGAPVRVGATQTAHVYVDTEPQGAQLSLEGRVLGPTPWGGDLELAHRAKLTLTLKGYAPAELELTPGVDVVETVTLKPVRAKPAR